MTNSKYLTFDRLGNIVKLYKRFVSHFDHLFSLFHFSHSDIHTRFSQFFTDFSQMKKRDEEILHLQRLHDKRLRKVRVFEAHEDKCLV